MLQKRGQIQFNDSNNDGTDSDTDTDKKNPIVYIYNTHQGEKYAYNIKLRKLMDWNRHDTI